MASSEEDEEVFEITDFTTATEWERFIARLEEVIHEWKLTNVKKGKNLRKGDITSGTWKKDIEEITFADTRFHMVHHWLDLKNNENTNECFEETGEESLPLALEDMMSMENDFPYRAHCLCRWYGLREFIVLAPPTMSHDSIISESKMKLLLSSVCIALTNSNCNTPTFVQVRHANESFYLGICEGGGVRTTFEMVHLLKPPAKSNHLAGLLDIFKAKLASPRFTAPVVVSVRFTYVLHDWTEFAWPQQPPDFDLLMGEVGVHELGQLPFGACEDPINELYLSTTWPCLSEDVIADNDVFSDLDPLHAPQWSLRVVMVDNPQCLLHEYVSNFLALAKRNESIDHLLGKTEDSSDHQYSQPLDRLTDLIPLNKSPRMIQSTKRQLKHEPISRTHMQQLLYYLFPDARPEADKVKEDGDLPLCESPLLSDADQEIFRSLKSVPPDTLTWRLALCMAHVTHGYKNAMAVAHLWDEFVMEMRYRWDISLPLPGLEGGLPNLATCLLHQKIHMLNCCIERKKKRESRPSEVFDEKESSSDEDEFFECTDEERTSFKDSVSRQPDGRLRKAGTLRLLNADQPMYIPITQEPTPMTEDLLEEHAEVLVQLGTDAEGAQLRAKMQSACLLSDMEAFKAANPSCTIEDFVRWYSPRDWIEEEGKSGHLSARMLLPGNVWDEVWETAKPVPARLQKRLFDDTREAEKVLHWLASLSLGQVVLHLMPVLLHVALATAVRIGKESLEPIIEKAAKTLRAPDLKKYEEISRLLHQVEMTVARVQSLQTKLGLQSTEDSDPVITELLQQTEVPLIGGSRGPIGSAVLKLFTIAQKSANLTIEDDSSDEETNVSTNAGHPSGGCFPKPAGREFILRANVPRPAPYSTPTPQRMFCVLHPEEVRLAGAFSQDTTFM